MLLLGRVYHFPSNSGRMHVLKIVCALMIQSFQKSMSLVIRSIWIPVSSPLNVHTHKSQYSTSLMNSCVAPDSYSRHDYDQDEVTHLSWVEGKTFCLCSSYSYILPSVAIGTFYLQRVPPPQRAQEETVRRCSDEGPQRVNNETTDLYCKICVFWFLCLRIQISCRFLMLATPCSIWTSLNSERDL